MRLPDWEERFEHELAVCRALPFDADTHNCALMACKVIEAITGRDFIPEYPRDNYRDQMRLLRKEGGLAAAVEKRLQPINLGHARRGDVALSHEGSTLALVVLDPPYAWGPGPDGGQRLDWTHIRKTYSVD